MNEESGNITARAFHYMREQIERGNWIVGELIPSENTLKRELGISRSSIRTAIKKFVVLGIMESHHGKGTYLKSSDLSAFRRQKEGRTEEELREITSVLEYRIIVECGTTALAVHRAPDIALLRLERYLSAMREHVEEPEEFVRWDLAFHREIAKVSGNLFLFDGLNRVLDNTHGEHLRLNRLVGGQNGIYYHTMILKALQERDERKAVHWMEMHLRDTLHDAVM